MDEKTYPNKQVDKVHLVGQFYYSLSQFQRKATTYVAHGETEDDKIIRLQDLVRSITKIGNEIIDDVAPGEFVPVGGSREDCTGPGCYWNEDLQMCMCPKPISD